MSIANQAIKKLNKMHDFTLWNVSLFFEAAFFFWGGGRLLDTGRLLEGSV